MKRRRIAIAGAFCTALLFAAPHPLQAQESQQPLAEAMVVSILSEKNIDASGETQHVQVLELRLTSGAHTGEVIRVEQSDRATVAGVRFADGDRVLVSSSLGPNGVPAYYISDRVRRRPLLALFALFVVLTVLVGRGRGVASLLAMGITFLAIFAYLLPRIIAGDDPIRVAITTSLVTIPATFYLSHGINRKTTAATVGTLISLVITGLLAVLAVDWTMLSGLASEEAAFIQAFHPGDVNLQGLLLAGIILGLSGILDDITVSQAAIVAQLRDAARQLSLIDVYRRAMDVGSDHIASLVNTLILVYASSAMPLLLLFVYGDASFREVVNYEFVAEEIVRMLVPSIGLILAVPITTAVACVMLVRVGDQPPDQ